MNYKIDDEVLIAIDSAKPEMSGVIVCSSLDTYTAKLENGWHWTCDKSSVKLKPKSLQTLTNELEAETLR